MTKPRPFGHYFILEKIAQGGMAEIFKGLTYDFTGLKKFVVIKRILPHIAANKEFIDMLINEAKIAVSLTHGNIAQTFDLGKVGRDYFIVMEYVDGKTFSQIIKKAQELKQNIPVPILIWLVSELCNGLDYIHHKHDDFGQAMNIIHRDISPQNIILSYSGSVKIVDFGVAKAALQAGEPEEGILKGKFAYMSPEQSEALEIDHHSDIFSAGIVLWEMLCQKRLFKKKNNALTIEAIKHQDYQSVKNLRDDIPEGLDEIISKALAKNPLHRFETAQDMSLALTKLLLKTYPDFKSGDVKQYLQNLFEDMDENTVFYQEKTILEPELASESEEATAHSSNEEDTMLVDSHALDFKSIFEDIDLEDPEEKTRAIDLDEIEETMYIENFSEEVSKHKLILNENESLTIHKNVLANKEKKHKPWLLLISFLFLFSFALFYFFIPGKAQLYIALNPHDSKIYLDDKLIEVKKGQAISINSGKHLLSLEHASYKKVKAEFRAFKWFNYHFKYELEKLSENLFMINSEPQSARIYINQKASPYTTPYALDVSQYTFPFKLGLSKEGYEYWEKIYSEKPKESQEIEVNLEALRASLEITSEPEGAEVHLLGVLLGMTPLKLDQLQAHKTYQLKFNLKGYDSIEQNVLLKSNEERKIRIKFKKNN